MSSTTTTHVAPLASYAPPADLARVQRLGLAAAVIGGLACVAGALTAQEQFFRSYLVAYLFWVAIALGCLGMMMMHHLTHGAWGVVVRRVFEAGASLMPVLALLFIPVLVGIPKLYVWAQSTAAADPILRAKAAYLNTGAFTTRAVVYFVIWSVLAVFLSRWSKEQDRTGAPALYNKMRGMSAIGLVLFVLSVSFATFDWLMSLDPHWFSSIYGLQFIGGCAIAGLCFAILWSRYLVDREPMSKVFRPQHHHDHGTLLFAFLLLWGYFTTSQFIIIWSANLPEEIPYFLKRFASSWKALALVLVLFHFWFPFLSLLSKKIKRFPRRLAFFAGWLLFMRWWELYFQAAPNFHPEGVRVHWLDAATVIAIGGVFVALAARHLAGRSLLPVHDPFLPEALNHE